MSLTAEERAVVSAAAKRYPKGHGYDWYVDERGRSFRFAGMDEALMRARRSGAAVPDRFWRWPGIGAGTTDRESARAETM